LAFLLKENINTNHRIEELKIKVPNRRRKKLNLKILEYFRLMITKQVNEK